MALTQQQIDSLALSSAEKAIRAGMFLVVHAASQYPDLMAGRNRFLYRTLVRLSTGVWEFFDVWTEVEDSAGQLVRPLAEVRARLKHPHARVESVEIVERLPTQYDAMIADLRTAFDLHFLPYFRNLFNQVWSSYRGQDKNRAIGSAWNAVNTFNNEIIRAFTETKLGPNLGWHVANFLVDYWSEVMVPLEKTEPGVLEGVVAGQRFRHDAVVDELTCRTCLSMNGQIVEGAQIQSKLPWAQSAGDVVLPKVHPYCRCRLSKV